MIANDHFVMTAEDIRQQKKDILFAYEEAKTTLSCLLLKAVDCGRRHQKIGSMLKGLEFSPEQPERSESDLLLLSVADFQDLDFATIRALANSIAAARRELAEATEAKRIAGY